LGFGRSKILRLRTNLPDGRSYGGGLAPSWAGCWRGTVRPCCHPCDGEPGLFQCFGLGTGSSSAPFLSGMLPYSSTIPNYHSYGEGISGCSAACYTAVSSGGTWGVSDGVGSGSVSQTSIFDQLSAAGLTWKGFCENGCPRGGDHYPSLQYASTYQSPNSVITST